MKDKTRLTKFPKLFSNSVFNFACKSFHVNSVSDAYLRNMNVDSLINKIYLCDFKLSIGIVKSHSISTKQTSGLLVSK